MRRRARRRPALPTAASLRVEPVLQHRGDGRRCETLRVRRRRPSRSAARRARSWRATRCRRRRRRRCRRPRTTFFTPGMLATAAASKLFTLPPNTGQSRDRGVQHAGQLHVDAVDLLAGDLVGGVEPLQRLAGDLPVLRVLAASTSFGGVELGRRGGHLAVAWSCGPTAACVITPLAGACTRRPAPSTRRPRPAPASSRAAAPPLRT